MAALNIFSARLLLSEYSLLLFNKYTRVFYLSFSLSYFESFALMWFFVFQGKKGVAENILFYLVSFHSGEKAL